MVGIGLLLGAIGVGDDHPCALPLFEILDDAADLCATADDEPQVGGIASDGQHQILGQCEAILGAYAQPVVARFLRLEAEVTIASGGGFAHAPAFVAPPVEESRHGRSAALLRHRLIERRHEEFDSRLRDGPGIGLVDDDAFDAVAARDPERDRLLLLAGLEFNDTFGRLDVARCCDVEDVATGLETVDQKGAGFVLCRWGSRARGLARSPESVQLVGFFTSLASVPFGFSFLSFGIALRRSLRPLQFFGSGPLFAAIAVGSIAAVAAIAVGSIAAVAAIATGSITAVAATATGSITAVAPATAIRFAAATATSSEASEISAIPEFAGTDAVEIDGCSGRGVDHDASHRDAVVHTDLDTGRLLCIDRIDFLIDVFVVFGSETDPESRHCLEREFTLRVGLGRFLESSHAPEEICPVPTTASAGLVTASFTTATLSAGIGLFSFSPEQIRESLTRLLTFDLHVGDRFAGVVADNAAQGHAAFQDDDLVFDLLFGLDLEPWCAAGKVSA